MSWDCTECGRDVVYVDSDESYVLVEDEWLCGECKQNVTWKPRMDTYDEEGNYVGS